MAVCVAVCVLWCSHVHAPQGNGARKPCCKRGEGARGRRARVRSQRGAVGPLQRGRPPIPPLTRQTAVRECPGGPNLGGSERARTQLVTQLIVEEKFRDRGMLERGGVRGGVRVMALACARAAGEWCA